MNLRWRDPAAVMHRDFIIFNSNSTITANFTTGVAVYHFSSSNSDYGTVSQQLAIIEDWRDLDEGGFKVYPIANSGYYFNGWICRIPGAISYEFVPDWIIADNDCLWFNNGQFSDLYPSGTEFRAVFSNSPTRKQYTVTITIAEWINNTWVQSGDYSLYWAGNDISSGKLSISKTFFEGDICHFNFIAGSDSYGYYEYRGVKDSNRNTVSGITEDNGLSFTVTSDINYYVEMMYQRY